MTPAPSPEEIAALVPKIRADAEKFVKLKGWTLNPDASLTDAVIEGLARNKLMRGNRFCPCRLPSGNAEADRQFICPCRESETDVETGGHCHCYLYMK